MPGEPLNKLRGVFNRQGGEPNKPLQQLEEELNKPLEGPDKPLQQLEEELAPPLEGPGAGPRELGIIDGTGPKSVNLNVNLSSLNFKRCYSCPGSTARLKRSS